MRLALWSLVAPIADPASIDSSLCKACVTSLIVVSMRSSIYFGMSSKRAIIPFRSAFVAYSSITFGRFTTSFLPSCMAPSFLPLSSYLFETNMELAGHLAPGWLLTSMFQALLPQPSAIIGIRIFFLFVTSHLPHALPFVLPKPPFTWPQAFFLFGLKPFPMTESVFSFCPRTPPRDRRFFLLLA